MEKNQFGKISRLSIQADCRDGKTVLTDISFTAPYKLMKPFAKPNGGAQIIPLCASAGIMRGDAQEFYFRAGEGTDLEVLSQSFDKIHKMEDGGSASRHIKAEVGANAVLYYAPQPVIPFADSAFDSTMEIELADHTARFFLLEITTCGRAAMEERFAYRRFSSKVLIYRGGELIYRDNTRYEPQHMAMTGIGMYEDFTHTANLFLSAPCSDLKDAILQVLQEADCEGGVTTLAQGDLAVRILGYQAQKLQQISEKIKQLYEEV